MVGVFGFSTTSSYINLCHQQIGAIVHRKVMVRANMFFKVSLNLISPYSSPSKTNFLPSLHNFIHTKFETFTFTLIFYLPFTILFIPSLKLLLSDGKYMRDQFLKTKKSNCAIVFNTGKIIIFILLLVSSLKTFCCWLIWQLSFRMFEADLMSPTFHFAVLIHRKSDLGTIWCLPFSE